MPISRLESTVLQTFGAVAGGTAGVAAIVAAFTVSLTIGSFRVADICFKEPFKAFNCLGHDV